MRLNPFPPEFGRETEEAVKNNVPDQQFSTQCSVIPQMSVGVGGSLAMNYPSLQAQNYNNPFSVPPPGFGNNPMVSSAISGNLSASVPNGSGFTKYPTPDFSSLGSGRSAGFRLDPTTGLHYDANSGLFFNPTLSVFLRWDPILNAYLTVDGPGLGAPSGSRSHNVDPGIHPPVSQLTQAPSALQGPICSANPSNLGPRQDEFMSEIWNRMRLMAKDVIGDVRNMESSSDSDDSSSSSSASNRSYKKDRKRRASRSRSPSGNHSKSRRNRSVSRGRHPSSCRRQSRDRGRRSRSRSPVHKRWNNSKSLRQGKRPSSRSLTNRNLCSSERRSRSRSGRSNSKGHSRGKRSASRSPGRRSRHRKNRSARTSRSPSIKKKKKKKKSRSHTKAKKSKSSDHHSPASTRRHLDSEKNSNSEPYKSGEEVTNNDSDLSEFDFLKDALDDDNQSIDDYEEVLDYDYIPESKSPVPTGDAVGATGASPVESGDAPVSDVGDPLSSFNDIEKHQQVIAAPIPGGRSQALLKDQLGNLESANITSVKLYSTNSIGLPFSFMFIRFATTEAASQWYNSHGGSLILSDSNGSRMKAYLHFSKDGLWSCESCRSKNFVKRVMCFRCYRHKDLSGFSPVSISRQPTKWVGLVHNLVSETTTESVLQSLPPLHDFNIQSTQVMKEPSGMLLGLCVFEVQSVEDGTRLSAFLSEQWRRCVYVTLNEEPVESATPENGDVGNVAGSSKSPVGIMSYSLSSFTGGNDIEADHLASLFVDKPTKTLLIYIKFSKKSRELKFQLTAAETFFRGLLKAEAVKYDQICFYVDKTVGAPCCYGLIEFPDAESAAGWRAKRGRAFSINVEGRKSVLTLAILHFSKQNWSCPSCDLSNFALRSLCHRCFEHKDGKSGPISLSMITTKWVVTSKVPCWFRDDEIIITELKKELNDFCLARIDILRDPDFPKLPQGCVLETGGWGDSLRLREFLQRTGRFAVFATTTTEFVRYTSTCEPDEDHENLTKKTDIDPESSAPVTESSALTTDVPTLPDAIEEITLPDAIEEITPDKPATEYLSWWIPNSKKQNTQIPKYSDILFHLFVENPLTRVTEGRMVFIGPLPNHVKFKTLQKEIASQLTLKNMTFSPKITISVSEQVGAPCNYALVTCPTPQDAEACVSKFRAGLTVNYENRQKFITACKTYVYLSKPNWTCGSCLASNFGLRSTCISCLRNQDMSPGILTFTDTPTNCVCVKNFPRRFSSPELMHKSYYSLNLLSKCTLKIPIEKSGVPLGVSVLEMENSDDAPLLVSLLEGGKLRQRLCYGIWGDGVREEPGNPSQVESKEEPCDPSVETGAEKVKV